MFVPLVEIAFAVSLVYLVVWLFRPKPETYFRTTEVLGLVLALIGLYFAVKQNDDSERIQGALSTRYIGMFPADLPYVADLVHRADTRLWVLTDLLGYGSYSDPAGFEKYFEELLHKVEDEPALELRVVVYTNGATLITALRNQFHDWFLEDDAFLDPNKDGKASQTLKELVGDVKSGSMKMNGARTFSTYFRECYPVGDENLSNPNKLIETIRRNEMAFREDLAAAIGHARGQSGNPQMRATKTFKTTSVTEPTFFWLIPQKDSSPGKAVISFPSFRGDDEFAFETGDKLFEDALAKRFATLAKDAPDAFDGSKVNREKQRKYCKPR